MTHRLAQNAVRKWVANLHGGARRATALVTSAALVVAAAAVVTIAAAPPAAAAVTPFACSGNIFYGTQLGATTGDNGVLQTVDVSGVGGTTVANTTVTNMPTYRTNGLGITKGGTAAYFFQQPTGTATGSLSLYKYVPGTGAGTGTTTFTNAYINSSYSLAMVAGAVDPATGIYYYGDYDNTSNNAVIYAWNTNTDTPINGIIGKINSNALFNGDFAFDAAGNLFIVGSNGTNAALLSIKGPLPTVGFSTLAAAPTLAFNTIATLANPNSFSFNGIAFGNDGSLFVQFNNAAAQGQLEKLSPTTGAVLSGPTPQSSTVGGDTDLASCQTPPTLQLNKTVNGRQSATDQFNLSITGGSVTSGNTATTTGSANGLQAAIAGPVVTTPGTTYTMTETAAGSTSLANYSSTYSCTDGTSVIQSGSGTSFTLPYPTTAQNSTAPAVTCSFTNSLIALTLVKTSTTGSVSKIGDLVTYNFAVANTGGVALNNVSVADTQIAPAGALTSGPTCASLAAPSGTCSGNNIPVLAAGQTATFTATYTASAADIASGSIKDTATATGTPTVGAAITTPPSAVTVPVTGITIVKSTPTTSITAAGNVVTYNFAVKNTGTVALTGVAVTDVQTAPAGALTSGPSCVILVSPGGSCSGSSTTLAAGQTATFTATYTATAADLTNGKVADSATASGTPPAGPAVTSTPSTATVPVATLAITKVASPASVSKVGDLVTYTFVATNTGTVTLTGVGITDTQTAPAGALTSGPTCVSLAAPIGTCTAPATTTLAAGQSATFTATYTASAADVANGSIKDSATTAGTAPDGKTVTSPPATASVPVAGLTIVKSTSTGSVSKVGDVITYSFAVKNTGTTVLTGVSVADTQLSPAGALTSGPTCTGLTTPTATCSGNSVTLAAGQSATFTATYTVTALDLANGAVNDSAVANGTPPSGTTITSPPSTATVPVAALTIVKTASPGSVSKVGDLITYTFAVKNTGTVPLTGVVVNDTQVAPAGALTSGPTCVSLTGPTGTCTGGSTPLAVGQSATFTATYTAKAADILNGSVNDSATATGTPPAGPAVTTAPSTAAVPVSGITLVKSSTTGSVSKVGDVITYAFVVKNTGYVPLTGVVVNDTQVAPAGALTSGPTCVSLTGPTGTCTGGSTPLAVGQSATFTATYTATAADIANGKVDDSATATGTPPSGLPVVSSPSAVSIPVSGLTLLKSSTTGSVSKPGDLITYSFVVRNTGTVPLTAVSVTDTQIGPAGGLTSGPTCSALTGPPSPCAGNSIALAVGQTAAFSATYTASAADIANGSVNDSAIATGTPPSGPAVTTPPSTVSIPVTGLTIVKSSTTGSVSKVGDLITYSFVVKNTGTVPLTAVSVTDAQTAPAGALTSGPTCSSLAGPAGLCSGNSTALAAGQTATFTAVYTVIAADLTNGSVNDSATATGTPPSGPAVTTPPSTVTVPVSGLTIVKSSTAGSVSKPGDVITYSFLVTNTGTVPLTAVSVSDTQIAPAGALTSLPTCVTRGNPVATCSGATTALAVGQTATFTATYTVIAADITNGSVKDSATATGTPPSGPAVTTPPSPLSVPVSGLTIVKSSSTGSVSKPGDVVTYSFLVTNTGTVPLTAVSVADTQIAPAGALTSLPSCVTRGNPVATCSGATTALAVGQTATFTATYTVIAADVTNGSVNDSATATGTPPAGPAVTTPPSLVSIPVSGLTIVKSSTTGSVSKVGDVVTYSFLVTNTGTVPLTAVSVTDTQIAPAGALTSGPTCSSLAGPAGLCAGNSIALAVGQSATFAATYTVTAADVANGRVDDSAIATGTPPSGPAVVAPPSTVTVPVSGLTLVKSSTTGSISKVGDVVTYSFVVKNTGTVPLTGVSVTDTQTAPAGALTSGPTCSSLSGPAGLCTGNSTTLAVGQSATFTATYTVTAADITNGSVKDSATATGTPPSGPVVTTPPSAVSVPVSGLTIVKSSSTGSVSKAGDLVTYSFLVTNTGTVSLTAVSVADTQIAPAGALTSLPSCVTRGNPVATCSGATTALAVGQTATFTATYTVIAADISNGSVNDSATATGTPPSGPAVTTPPSTVTVPVTGLTLIKSSTTGSISKVGDIITYSFAVKNTSTVALTGVTVTDTQIAPAGLLTAGPTCVALTVPANTCSGNSVTLAAGQTAIFTATYTATAADISNRRVDDSAIATGTPPSGPAVVTPPSTVSVPVTGLTLVKSSTAGSISKVGDVVTYSFLVTNTGSTALTNVSVTDTQLAPAGPLTSTPTCSALAGPTGTCAGSTITLAAGQSATFTATYTATAADLTHGRVDDTATATGTPPSGPAVVTPPSTVSVPVAALTIVKSSTTGSVSKPGEVISYSFLVTNTGTVPLTGVSVTDTQIAPAGALTSGPVCQSLAGPTAPCTGNSVTLSAGQSATFTAVYTVIAADLTNGSVNDSAIATGTPTSGPAVTTPPSTVAVPVSGLTIVKSSTTGSVSKPGDLITYSFLVTNTGTVPLSGVSVADTQVAPAGALASGPTCQSLAGPTAPCTGNTVTLAVGQSATFGATYVVTAADLANGSVNDSATATGTPPSGPAVTTAPSTVSVPVTGLTIVKSSTTGSISAVGDVITYSFVVTNTGTVTMSDVSVTDTQLAPAGVLASGPTCTILAAPAGVCTGGSTVLLAGQSATFTATYVATAADIGHGRVDDSATATGTPPSGPSVTTPPATLSVPVAGLTIVKSSTAGSVSTVGETVTYSFLVTNTGSVPLSGVSVTDTQIAPAGALTSLPSCVTRGNPVATCSGATTALAVGQTATFTATYTVTAADLTHGKVDDSATATGTPPAGPAITTPPSTVSVPVSALTIVKSSTAGSVSKVGDVVTYSFLVTNTGTVSLSAVSVADIQIAPAGSLASGPTCQSLAGPTAACTGNSVTLAVGQSATFTATYTVTAADLANGSVNDSATATGTPPSGPAVVTPPSTVSIPVTGLTIVKSSTTGSISKVGDVVSYSFAVKNTGTVPLTGVSVTDTQIGPAGGLTSGPICQSLAGPTALCSGNSVTLAVGQTGTFSATYTVTAADLTNGSVNDSAIATGTPPSGPAVITPPSTVSVPVAALTIVKSSTTGSVSKPGEVISYSFLVTNTGTVPLTGVSVTDTQIAPAGALTAAPVCASLADPAGTCTGPSVALAVGQSATFTAAYTVTAADVAHGKVDDSATATGTPPAGPAVTTAPSTVSVPVSGLTIVKSSTTGSVSKPGDVITYSFLVTNTGTVTMSGVSVADTQVAPAGVLASGPTCTILAAPAGVCTGGSTVLLAGQSATFGATYVVTAADLANGSVNDSATATGTPPSGPAVTTAPSTVSVPVTGLTIVKSSTTGSISAVGDVITYSFVVTNTGTVTMSGVSVTDTQLAPAGVLASGPTCTTLAAPAGVCTGGSTVLLAGQSATFTATYVATAADIGHGRVDDSATATGTPPSGPSVTTPPATLSVPVAGLTIVKSSTAGSVSTVGETVTYSFLVTNTGSVPLSGVSVTDTQIAPAGALASGPECATLTAPTDVCTGNSVTLAAGQSGTFTATYVVTAADLTNGSINDSAIAAGTPPAGPAVTTPPSLVSIPVTGLTLVKSSSTGSISQAGDLITYSFLVKNTGTVPLTGVTITDTQLSPAVELTSGPTCTVLATPTGLCAGSDTTLAVGQSATFTASYTATTADIAHGRVDDSAIATGTPPAGPPVITPPSTVSVPVAGLSIVKSSDAGSVSEVGDTITYQFEVSNTGTVPLSAVSVADTQISPAVALTSGPTCSVLATPAGTCSGSSTTLAAGQSATFTATYTVTAADLTKGSVDDSATATGTPPAGPPVITPPSTVSVPVSGLSIVKSSDAGSVSSVGDVVSYSFLVTNTGSVPLTGVSVTDVQVAPAGALDAAPMCTALVNPTATCSGTTVSLAAGQRATFTASYTVTAADLTKGSVDDSATATGTPPAGPPVITPPSTVSVPVSGLSIVKSSDAGSVSSVGDVVSYSFLVTNTGSVPLSGVSVTDVQVAPAGALDAAPVCTALAGPAGTCSGGSTTLAAGQSATFTATYTVTAADLTAGGVNDSATATGTPPAGPPVTTPPSTVSVPVTGLTIVKTSNAGSVSTVGEVITYQFKVINTGSVPLSGVSVTDTQVSPAVALTSGPTCTVLATPAGTCSGNTTTLAPGQSATFTATYTVTALDLAAGSVNDSARATGTPPAGPPVTTPPSTVSVPVTGLTIVKSTTAGSVSAVGDVITYSFLVTNTGTVPLTGVSVDDTQNGPAGALTSDPTCVSLAAPAGTCTGAETALAVGQSATFTATYTVTTADLAHGSVNDSATATGTPPSGPPVITPPSTVSVPVTGLTIVKSSETGSVGKIGDVVTYSFLVTNTGTVPLTDVSVTDTQISPAGALTSGPDCSALAGPVGTCNGNSITLAAGQSAVFTATYTTKAQDILNRKIDDSATATGTPPAGPPVVTPPSTLSIPVSAVTVFKSANVGSVSKVGQVITFTFLVTNAGILPLSSVSVEDSPVGGSSSLDSAPTCVSLAAPAGSCSGTVIALAAGQSAIFTAPYTVTAVDLANGSVADSAVADGTPPVGPPDRSPPSTVSIPVAALTIVKSSPTGSVSKVGDSITYHFAVANTGTVPLHGVSVTDTQVSPAVALTSGPTCVSLATPTGTCSGNSIDLAVGQTADFTASYVVTAADLAHGKVDDSAIATGTPPEGPPVVTPPSVVSVPVAGLTVTKSASPTTAHAVGDLISYRFVVHNTGTVTLTGINLTDRQLAPAGALTSGPNCPSTVLAAAASMVCTGTYRLTLADVDQGKVTDTATAVGTPPSGPPVTTPPSTVVVPVPPAPGISLVKTASPAVVHQVGDIINYQFRVTNTGNVTLTAVTIADQQVAPAGVLISQSCPAAAKSMAPGAVVDCIGSYRVTAADVAHGAIDDTAVASGTPPTGSRVTSDPSKAHVPVVIIGTPALTISKTVDHTTALPGEVVHYTITVQNVGGQPFTTAKPAAFTDDLSAVLDDATYNDDVSGGAIYAAPVLSWSGPLAVGARMTFGYSVTVNVPDTGDRQLVNRVVSNSPGSPCATGSTDSVCATLTVIPLPPPPLPNTGAPISTELTTAVLLLLLGLGALLFGRRRLRL